MGQAAAGAEAQRQGEFSCVSEHAEACIHMENEVRHPLPRPLKRSVSSATLNETSQIAMIGVQRSHIESLDYDTPDNDIFKEDWRSKTGSEIVQFVVVKWTMACLIGICTGLVAFAVNISVENISGLKLLSTLTFLESDRYLAAALVLGGGNLLLVLLSVSLCAFVAPEAAGSGIPEVKAYLNGIDAPNILSPKTLFVKVLGSIGAVSGGLYLGKEAPLLHSGACIASFLTQGGSKRFKLTWKWLRILRHDRLRRDLITCGAAAGIAVAFRAPVGGVIFALEEMASWWRSALLWRVLFTTACVTVVRQAANNLCQGDNCGVFGYGGLIVFDMSVVSTNMGLIALVPAMLLGILGGVLGSLFTFLSRKIAKFYSGWHSKHESLGKVLQALFVSIITSIFIFGLPWLATCTPCPSTASCPSSLPSGAYKRFTCASGYYNDLAGLMLSTNDGAIRILFNNNSNNEFQYFSLVLYLVWAFALALITYGLAIPSGLFLPVILVGATYGRLTGKFLKSHMGFENIDEGLFAYMGAASFLGGSMRIAVSLCVILLELTNNLLMLPWTMLILLISKTVGDLFNVGVYDQIVFIKGFPFLEEKPEPYMKHLTAGDVCSCPAATLSAIERVGNIVEVLRMTDHNGFPVLEMTSAPYPTLHGLILRSHLLVLLQKKDLFSQNASSLIGQDLKSCKVDFYKRGSGKGPTIDDIQLTAQEEDMFLDLHPFTNISPYTISEDMSLAKAFSLFRQLGLRHLCVVPKTKGPFPVSGILTRHDFMPEYVLGLFPHLKVSKWRRLRIRISLFKIAGKWWG
ncbi:hypothetical protein GOP47_0011565 [Adiantum capillus-veneris]|uniref:Chloride channel protein n=1 Tax=Adiantum capillus-veneris TaxID=13818 RepID=A0A9D4ZGV8_ADICA|nr:hypothetical protein GOP47_0011565 [Adiantum capillus-veneris]